MFRFTIVTIVLCFLPLWTHAQDNEYVELHSRYTKLHVNFTVNKDFTVEKISEIEIKALTDRSVQNIKKQRFSHSTSIEKFEVLEAYTLKADGSKITVPKDNYQVTINKGNGKSDAIFSDRTRVTIVFPDFEKNDSVYMKIKKLQTEPMFANHFSTSRYFWSQRAYDDVKISFDIPKDLIFRHQVRDMEEMTNTHENRKTIELIYSLKKPIKVKRDDFSVWDESQEAGYAFSTFPDYETLAKAYGERATPKGVPTKKVTQLVKEIIGDEQDQKEQARLLYDWVTTNISYGGNCIGVGAVVPHDTDFIIDNRMGDCKDHAVLIEAFFSVIGVDCTQALINSGSTYSLPEIPLVSSVNHVINYIPKWDKFVDSTNSSLPFDSLAFSLSDKPVLLVDDFIKDFRTPATQTGDNYQEIESKLQIHPDGSAEGNIYFKMRGRPAIDMRRAWRHTTKEQEAEWLKNTFSSKNQIGSATMTKDDPRQLLSDFNYSFAFKRPEFILAKGAGGFYTGPLVSTPMEIYSFLNYPKEEITGYDIACSNGRSIEKLTYVFPKDMKILAKPEDFEIEENHIYFKANYQLKGNTLEVFREINDHTPGNICSAETMNKQRQTLIKISKNLQEQVIYQH